MVAPRLADLITREVVMRLRARDDSWPRLVAPSGDSQRLVMVTRRLLLTVKLGAGTPTRRVVAEKAPSLGGVERRLLTEQEPPERRHVHASCPRCRACFASSGGAALRCRGPVAMRRRRREGQGSSNCGPGEAGEKVS